MSSTHDQFAALYKVFQEAMDQCDQLATACTIATLCGGHMEAAGYAQEWNRWRVARNTILDLQTDVLLLDVAERMTPDAAGVEAGG